MAGYNYTRYVSVATHNETDYPVFNDLFIFKSVLDLLSHQVS